MSVIAWIILGLAAGWIASMLMNRNSSQGPLEDIVLGVLGANIGGAVFTYVGGTGLTGFNLYSLFVAVIGAAALIGLRRMLARA